MDRTTNKTQLIQWGYGNYSQCRITPYTYAMSCPSRSKITSSQPLGTPLEFVEYPEIGLRVKKFQPFSVYGGTYSWSGGTYCNAALNVSARFDCHPFDWMAIGNQASLGVFPSFGKNHLQTVASPYLEYATQALLAEAKAPDFSGATELAQLLDTLTSIKDAIWGAVKIFDDPSVVLKLVTAPEEVWLWYRYVLMTTILTVTELASAIKGEPKSPFLVTGGSEHQTRTGTCSTGRWWGSIYWDYNWVQQIDIHYNAQGILIFRYDPSPFGMSAADVVAAGWEVIPFSFVIDWFVSVQQWLTLLRQVDLRWGQRYSSVRVDVTTDIKPAGSGLSTTTHLEESFYVRVVDPEFSYVPLLASKWNTVNHLIDAISLIVGLLRGKIQSFEMKTRKKKKKRK